MTTTNETTVNATAIADHLAWLHPTPGTWFELRGVGRGAKAQTWAGHVKDGATAWAAGVCKDRNAYVTLNPMPEKCKSATDAVVLQRTNLLIDIDAGKPSADVNATDDEKQVAAQAAVAVREFLSSHGWADPLHVDSGNGYHVIYAIDLPADDDRVKRLLHALHARWPAVDRTTHNASRITKLAGTLVSKTPTPAADRPMRVAKLLDVPARVVVPAERIDAVLAALPQPERVVVRDGGRSFTVAEVNSALVATNDVLRRAREYLSRIDPAISGQPANPPTNTRHGHDQTMHAACALVLGFNLSPDATYPLLAEWNERCQPPWDEDELRHKLRSAVEREGARGYLLTATADTGQRAAWDNPQRIASDITAAHTLRFLGSVCYRYADDGWRELSDAGFKAIVQTACREAADAEYKRLDAERVRLTTEYGQAMQHTADKTHGEHREAHRARAEGVRKRLDKLPAAVLPSVTTALTANARAEVAARCVLPDAAQLNGWVGGGESGYRLRLLNGLLDPTTGLLWPHTPYWFSTTRLPVAYDKDAQCLRWEAVVGELMEGDADRMAVVQEVFGACLDPTLPAKFFAGFVGDGDNGKSVALVVLRTLLGAGNVCSVGLDELTANRFAAWGMYGRLANVVGDQGYFDSADEGRLKTLTGGDVVCFERKGCDPVYAVNSARIIFACNSPPTFSDKTRAVWNRAVLVPFTYSVPAERKNSALLTAEHWAGELPGILNWALRGLARLRAAGRFTPSAKCETLKQQHRRDSNPALEFLRDRCEAGGFTPSAELYVAYTRWCGDSGYKHPLTARKLAEEVKRAYPEVTSGVQKANGKASRGWVGLRMVTDGNAAGQ